MEVIATKYAQLGYCFVPPYFWRIIDLVTNQPIGPRYCTQAELLTDLDQFAEHFLCGRSTPRVPATRRTADELLAMVNANLASSLIKSNGDANHV